MIRALSSESTLPRIIGLAGLAGCVAALLVAMLQPDALAGWLPAFLFWSSLPIGALCLLMMIRLIPGSWGDELDELAQVAILLIPLAALTILPVLFSLGVLYSWVDNPPETGLRAVYLTSWFFIIRTLVFFAVIALLAILLIASPQKSTPVSAAGLILFTLIDTVMAVDWFMSLDAEFHSSGFGLYVLSIQMTIALAMLILMRLFAPEPPTHTGVLGGLLLTVLMLWAYFSFMQYFISWSDDLPQSVLWYQKRATGLWSAVEYAIGSLHLLPAFLLLFPNIRRSPAWLAVLAPAVLIGKTMEAAWLILPAFDQFNWVALVVMALAWAGLGALSIAGVMVAPQLMQRWAGHLPIEEAQQ